MLWEQSHNLLTIRFCTGCSCSGAVFATTVFRKNRNPISLFMLPRGQYRSSASTIYP